MVKNPMVKITPLDYLQLKTSIKPALLAHPAWAAGRVDRAVRWEALYAVPGLFAYLLKYMTPETIDTALRRCARDIARDLAKQDRQ